MTANRIKEVALAHFARYGYAGTSLTNIANDVGIKKPSIYAHYKGKEELYFVCLDDALNKDLSYIREHILQHQQQPVEYILYHLLSSYGERYRNNTEAAFWLRSSFFPPDELKERIVEKGNAYVIEVARLLYPLFEQVSFPFVKAEDALEAYLCLFDGLIIELLYAGFDKFQKRLNASWGIYWRGTSI
jgi:AcrR family transcriptional regulator